MRELLAILAGTSLADLIHTTPGPGDVFTKTFLGLEVKEGRFWKFVLDAMDCHRCLSFYSTVALLLMPQRLAQIIAPALIATKLSQLLYRRWEEKE